MKIYHYHPTTGEYLGEGIADESPLEKGVFLIPANATGKKPPKHAEGKATVFYGEWEHIEIETVAEKDIDNTSPSTETAFQKVVRLLESVNSELVDVKVRLIEKEERINKLEKYNEDKEKEKPVKNVELGV